MAEEVLLRVKHSFGTYPGLKAKVVSRRNKTNSSKRKYGTPT